MLLSRQRLSCVSIKSSSGGWRGGHWSHFGTSDWPFERENLPCQGPFWGKESLVGKVSWKKQLEKHLIMYEKSSLLVVKCSKRFDMVQRPPWHPAGIFRTVLHHLKSKIASFNEKMTHRKRPFGTSWGQFSSHTPAASRMIHQTSIDVVVGVIWGYHSFDKDIG